ncbi:hypothetical protein [Rheinheimera sp. MM224]|uniref:hypothetical protein n=1 Tax=Rheinheimera sp. MM224 TaxID=3019969 RepID=UPI0021F8FC1F|nr:hypothetical protein [Rheinheimera sp. MM224]CAI3803110.1 hypothetical protein JAMGFMIE_03279 [Rheinheimera sp. MM224]
MKISGLTSIALCLSLTGCSAALVPSTSEPRQKIEQAYELISAGRAIPAEKLALEAVNMYLKESNFIGAGNAETVLGVLYSSSAYHTAEAHYRELGTFDPTPEKSKQSFMKAVDFYKKGGEYWGAANALIGVGDAFSKQGDNANACLSYREALQTYLDPNAIFTGTAFTWNPKYPSYQAMLEAIIQNTCKATT